MVRELKFRVWDKRRNKFLNSKDIVIRLNGEVAGIHGGSGTVKEWILNQYTGLKDKNGKEIYEGDIIKTYHNKVAIVKWDGPEAAFNQFEKTEGWLCYNFDSCEIIGDIYNNPELLK